MAHAGAQVLLGVVMKVLVINQAAVPADILTRAEAEASRAYAAAGVDIVWVDADSIPETPASEYRLSVIVTNYSAKRRGISPDAMGVAATTQERAGIVAYAFYDRTEKCARAARTDVATLLGHVIAHEMGHLLLGFDSHSPTGLMRARWELCDRSRGSFELSAFTNEQAASIRLKAVKTR